VKNRVTIVCSNNGKNCLGRALLLGDLLRTQYDVSVVGIRTTEHDWQVGRSFELAVHSYPIRTSFELPSAARWLRARLVGTRVIVCKPKPTSLGLALAAGVRPSRAILDVDDWDLGFGDAPKSNRDLLLHAPYYLKTLLHPGRFNSYLGVRASFGLARAFPQRLVSNGWLKREIGGALLPHVRDSRAFDPEQHDGRDRRIELDMQARPWVGFVGTVRPHKGIEDLIAALALLAGPLAPGLLLAGLSEQEVAAERELVKMATAALGQDRVRAVSRFPFSELPAWLMVPDVICIPSRPGATSAGQIPAKMFDALMMAKPLVVSNAHDTSDVDDDAAVRFEAGNVRELATKLDELCADAGLRERLARRARIVALARFDYDVGRRLLEPMVSALAVTE
jgi:glycosyltransferase involved in cell wall biosynthesis